MNTYIFRLVSILYVIKCKRKQSNIRKERRDSKQEAQLWPVNVVHIVKYNTTQ
ncbi:hypothetical protein Hanom_Chr13g01200601 [Helianthus anomalus]